MLYSQNLVGAYDLICWTRTVKEQWMAHITTPGYEGTCFASGWYDELFNQVMRFYLLQYKNWIIFIHYDIMGYYF